MDIDLSMAMAVMQAGSARQSIATAIVKKSHEMDMAMVQMVADVAKSAPPPGQGKAVDKLA